MVVSSDDNFELSFINAANTPAVTDCYYAQNQSIGNDPAFTKDLQYSIKCTNNDYDCFIRHNITWGCYIPCCWSISFGQYSITCNNGAVRTSYVIAGEIGTYDSTTDVFQPVPKCKTSAAASSSTTSFTNGMDKAFKRKSMTGTKCDQVGTCEYRCARGYQVTMKNDYVTFTPASDVKDCECETLTGRFEDSLRVYLSPLDMYATYNTTESTNLYVWLSASNCAVVYSSGTTTPKTIQPGSYTRESISQSCSDSSSCINQCTAVYTISYLGTDMLIAQSKVTNPSQGCVCPTVNATLLDDGSAFASTSGYTYEWTSQTSGPKVVVTKDGVKCTATYGQGKPTTSTTTQTTSATASTIFGSTSPIAVSLAAALAAAFVAVRALLHV